jgi:hypothetical protein
MNTLFDELKLEPEVYDSENPQVWQAFKNATFRLINAGVRRYGAKAIFEHIRFQTAVSGKGTFKMNNNYTSYYARRFMREYPAFKGFFETRKLKS